MVQAGRVGHGGDGLRRFDRIGVLRKSTSGHKVGPLFADDAETAARLLAGLTAAMLEYIPELGGSVWHANNWQMHGTWLHDFEKDVWRDSRSNGGGKAFEKESPEPEQIGYPTIEEPKAKVTLAKPASLDKLKPGDVVKSAVPHQFSPHWMGVRASRATSACPA